jgi:asparagine synthetase B (glutamine-hydrolysing)
MISADASDNDDQMSSMAPVAVLFSGGLDSMILSSILDICLPPQCKLNLIILWS